MIRFSKIIGDSPESDLKKKDKKKEEISLRKTGILTKDKVGEKDAVKEAKAYCQKLFTLAEKVQSWVQKDEVIDISLITPVLTSIIENRLIEPLYYYIVFEGDKGDKGLTHAIGLTIFSLKIGIAMEYDNERLLNLAMVAFLHDIGMYKISSEILNKEGRLSEEELKEIQRHPEIGAEILSGLGEEYKWLAPISLQVHERADGSGYPRGLKDEEIHEYAYIVGLVDTYSAMIKDRPYRDRIEKNKAMRSIIVSSKGRFPVKILKVFLNEISFFPINSFVKLNDYSVGRVITTNPAFPLKPTVEILYDSMGNRLKGTRIVDLSKDPLLYITGSVDEKDIN